MLQHFRFLLIALILSGASTLMAQQRFHNFAGTNFEETGHDAQWAYWDNGFIISGLTWFPGTSEEAALYKTDMVGAHTGATILGRYGTPSTYERFNRMSLQDINGSPTIAAVGAYSTAPGSSDLYFVLTDQNGNVINVQAIGSSGSKTEGMAVTYTSDGGFGITGYTTALSGDRDFYVVKLDANFNVQWTTVLGTSGGDDQGYSIIENNSNNLVAVGFTESLDQHNNQGDILVVELDLASGAIVGGSYNVYGNIGRERGFDIGQKATGEYFITGESYSNTHGTNIATGVPTTSDSDIFLLELTMGFGIISYHQYGNAASEHGTALIWDAAANNYYITGIEYSISFGLGDGFLLAIDGLFLTPLAANSWHYGGPGEDYLMRVTRIAADNGFYMGGTTESFSPGGMAAPNFYHLKTNAAGNTGCHEAMYNPRDKTPAITSQTRTGKNTSGIQSKLTHVLINTPYNFDSLCFFPCKNPHFSAQDLTEEITKDQVALSPNPSTDLLTISYSGTSKMAKLRVLDLQGRVVSEFKVDSYGQSISIQDLQAGVYFLETSLYNGQRLLNRFIKQ